MRWKRLGKIFDPTDHKLPANCAEYAQSPQTLVFDDFVRIYFSTRSVDQLNQKFRSHIAFVDMTKDLSTVLKVSDQEAIPLGELGAFDEHGIFPINVLRHGGVIYAYTCGWSRRVSVSVETAIGMAISRDNGLTFEKHGSGPVLSSSLHEPCLVGDGFVLHIESVFHMWYIFGTGWKQYSEHEAPDRTYKIGHATSSDGVEWDKQEARRIIPDLLGEQESQALPTVIRVGSRFHMYFCYRYSHDFRKNPSRTYRIGHAWSDDLLTWQRGDDPFERGAPGDWDSEMQCYPHVFEMDGRVLLLYNGSQFGRGGFGVAELVE
jgi:hypothetical protein